MLGVVVAGCGSKGRSSPVELLSLVKLLSSVELLFPLVSSWYFDGSVVLQ